MINNMNFKQFIDLIYKKAFKFQFKSNIGFDIILKEIATTQRI